MINLERWSLFVNLMVMLLFSVLGFMLLKKYAWLMKKIGFVNSLFVLDDNLLIALSLGL